MGMTLKELLTKGEGTLTAGEAKTLASQCRMDVETLYTLLEERGIKILDDEADGDTSLDVEGIMAEVESAEANSDELGLGDENEDDPAEENPADLKAAMDELLDDPVKNYLKQIGQIPLLSAEQEVDLSKRIHAGAEAAHILQADRQKYGAPEYIKKNSARFSFEEDENSRSYTEDLDEEGNTKSSEDDEEKAAEEEAMEAVENGPLTEERRQELLKIRRDGLNARRSLSEANLRLVVSIAKKHVGHNLAFLDLIQTVENSIFYNWLQNHFWNQAVFCILRDFQFISDPSLKTNFDHIQIFVDDIQFIFQRNKKSTFDRIAEQICHICTDLCDFRNIMHQRNPTHTL